MKKSTQIISYISYIMVFIAAVFFAVFYLRPFFFLLLLLVICLPFISYFVTKYAFLQLSSLVYIKPFSTVCNQNATLYLEIHNPTKFPVTSAGIQLSFRSFFYETTDSSYRMFPLLANNDNVFQFTIKLSKCGLYEARICDFCVYDFLHLFSFHKQIDTSCQIRVFPDAPALLKRHEALYSEGFDEFEESGKTGNVSANVTDIREYQPGDRLQKIHWKLSTKIDKLMVKENESTSSNEFLLLMELFQPKPESCNSDANLLNALEHTIQEAWAIAMELIQNGEVFVFGIYSVHAEDFVMSTIRSKEDLENAFFECYFHPTYDTEHLALDVYEASGLRKGTLLHVTHKGVEDVIA